MKTFASHIFSRWILLVALLCAGLLPSALLAQTAATYHARADQALQSFLLKFWNGGSQYLRERYPDTGSLTGPWTYANGWDAVLDGVERTGGQQYAGLIESFYLGENQRYGWILGYYDDECWLTLALIRAYDLTANLTYLAKAQTIFADIQGGWDSTRNYLWWDKAHSQYATAANAGAALAGAKLYQRTTNGAYLTFAQQVYSRWFANMVDPTTFQVCDHLGTDGVTKTWWKFTYNEGLMIGASVALYEATGTTTYLTNAHHIANFMINNEFVSTAYGKVLIDGSNSTNTDDAHEFKGPAYRYLMNLYKKDTTKTQYYTVLKNSADAIWNLARETNLNVFAVNWAGPAQTNVDQQQDNAACMGLNLFAEQFGAYPGSGIPANQFEAENATIHNILLEANGSGFTGWGYLAGWNASSQWVDFKVNFPTPGGRTLTFRYAAGAGNASRLIAINGSNAFTNLAFASTGSWTSYNSVSVAYTFPAGLNTISVMINPAFGNANYLNLDNLTVTDLRITGLTVAPGGAVQISWNAVPGQTYHLQYATPPIGVTWNNLGNVITATNTTASATDTVGGNTARYYRLRTP